MSLRSCISCLHESVSNVDRYSPTVALSSGEARSVLIDTIRHVAWTRHLPVMEILVSCWISVTGGRRANSSGRSLPVKLAGVPLPPPQTGYLHAYMNMKTLYSVQYCIVLKRINLGNYPKQTWKSWLHSTIPSLTTIHPSSIPHTDAGLRPGTVVCSSAPQRSLAGRDSPSLVDCWALPRLYSELAASVHVLKSGNRWSWNFFDRLASSEDIRRGCLASRAGLGRAARCQE